MIYSAKITGTNFCRMKEYPVAIKTENAKAFLPATIEEYSEYIKGK